jgi:ribosomal protein S6
MSYSTNYTKKELETKLQEKDELIKQLKDKLVEMKGVEKQVNAESAELPELAIGLTKDSDGNYYLAKVNFDPKTKAAFVTELEKSGKDAQIASYKAKQVLVEDIYLPLIDSKFKK